MSVGERSKRIVCVFLFWKESLTCWIPKGSCHLYELIDVKDSRKTLNEI